MFIPKLLDKELLLVLPSTMLDDTFNFISRSGSISIDRTQIGICPGGELVIWILQPGSQKRSVDRNKTRGSKGDLKRIVVSLRHAEEHLVGSHKDRLEFVKLSLFGEAGGRDHNELFNIVLQRETAVFIGLLSHGDSTLNKLSLDSIPKSIKNSVRSKREGRKNNSSFELRSKTHAESVSEGVPGSIDRGINSHVRNSCSYTFANFISHVYRDI